MSGVTGKRKSRFESSDDLPNAKRISYTEPQAGDGGSLSAAAAAAAAKAAEISRDLSNKVLVHANKLLPVYSL